MAEQDQVNPAEHVVDNQSFYNAALTGSGTILPDGTYGDVEPDPTVEKAKKGELAPADEKNTDEAPAPAPAPAVKPAKRQS